MPVVEIILHSDAISKEELNAEAWLAEPRPNRAGLDSEHPGHVVDVVVVWEFLINIIIEVLRVKSSLCKGSGGRGDVAAYVYSSDLVNCRAPGLLTSVVAETVNERTGHQVYV